MLIFPNLKKSTKNQAKNANIPNREIYFNYLVVTPKINVLDVYVNIET